MSLSKNDSKQIFIRKCVGCGVHRLKTDFIRVVCIKNPKNKNIKKFFIDKTFKENGRGVYICKNENCLKNARKSRRFERVFTCKLGDEFYFELEKAVFQKV